MHKTLLCAFAAVVAATCGARTLSWKGVNGTWSDASKWNDNATGTTAATAPEDGDTILIGVTQGTMSNDIEDLAPYQIRLSGGYRVVGSTTDKAVTFLNGSAGIRNETWINFNIPVKWQGVGVIESTSGSIVMFSPTSSADGEPYTLVKKGAGAVSLRFGSCTGLAGIEHQKGTLFLAAACSNIPAGIPWRMTGTATLSLQQNVTLADFNFAQSSGVTGTFSDEDGKGLTLTLTGTPTNDSTVLNGKVTGTLSIAWNPAASSKEIVFSGGTNTTTGSLTVSNGTMRVTGGATFTNMDTLRLKGGSTSRFVIDTGSGAGFAAKRIIVETGDERISIPAGVTITVGNAAAAGHRLAAGTYCGRTGTGGTPVDWIEGAGLVTVDGSVGDTIKWVDGNSDKKWSTAANWMNMTTGEQGVLPQNGDTVYITRDGGSTKQNDLVGLELQKMYIAGGYHRPQGNAVTFRAGAYGVESDGFLYVNQPFILEGTNFTFSATDMTSYWRGFKSYTPGEPCGFVKTGKGILGISPYGAASAEYADFKYVAIAGGQLALAAQAHWNAGLLPAGLEISFAANNTELSLGTSCTLEGLVLLEAEGVTGHKIVGYTQDKPRSGTLTITGSPRVDSMRFTGTFEKGANFCWSPSSSAKEFVIDGSSSSTTGRLEVANGTLRLANGATFTALDRLTLSGGAGSRFVVDAPPAAFSAKQLVLESGNESMALAAGVTLAFASGTVSVNGNPLADGRYCAPGGLIGTPSAWIAGGGCVCVGDVPPLPSPSAGDPTAAAWTANGGADTATGNAANWGAADNTELPDLTGGTLEATFAAGTGAALDRVANLRGISLTAPGAFAFTSAGAGLYAALGAGGISTSNDGRTYTMGWPLYLAAAQTWTVKTNDTLAVNASVLNAAALTIRGGGTLNFNAAGELGNIAIVEAKAVNVNADNAFGMVGSPVDIDLSSAPLTLNGVTLARGFRNTAETSGRINVTGNTTNVIEGDLDLSPPQAMYIYTYEGAELRIKGRLMRGTTAWCSFREKGTVQLDGPVTMVSGSALALADNVQINFNAPSNNLGRVWFGINGPNTRIRTTVPYAFTADLPSRIRNTNNNSTGGVWDMCGGDQSVLWLCFTKYGFTITSEAPATLHVKPPSNLYPTDVTNLVVFTGAASYSYEPSAAVAHMLNAASSSTGTLHVANGELAIGPNGSWLDASAVEVTGGTLTVENVAAFGRGTDMHLDASGGTVNLTYAGTMRMHNLYVGGVLQRPGLYGGSGRFTGSGRIVFLGDAAGTVLFVR